MSNVTLHLSKQNFKFSAAHFLIFDSQKAEKLHGHNYQVRVDIKVPQYSSGESGFFVDFNVFKKWIKQRLDQWDEHVLLPGDNLEMQFGESEGVLEVRFRERFYAFPRNEVILLPVVNTSVEELSRILAEEMILEFSKFGVSQIRVYVEETRGQGASTTCRGTPR